MGVSCTRGPSGRVVNGHKKVLAPGFPNMYNKGNMMARCVQSAESKEDVVFMGRPLEIVVVDDEKQITELLRSFIGLASKNARVHTFNDATAAREFLLSNNVDMLITDYKMPVYDGLQLLSLVPPEVKKILISGYVSEIAEEKLQEMNALFFEKPVPIRTLGKIISEQEECVA